jgi:hypothetical protein
VTEEKCSEQAVWYTLMKENTEIVLRKSWETPEKFLNEP